MEPRTFIFFGPSGAGKGTQAKLLATYLEEHDREHETIYLSTGNLFRSFMETDTYTARRVKHILDEGGLPLEFLAIALWTQHLNKHVRTGSEHIIMDGVARRYAEAPILEHALAFYERSKTTDVLIVNVSREEAIKRLKERGRYDDTDEEINVRLDWFDTNVVPAIDYFRTESSCRVHDVNGEQSTEKVHREILQKIGL